MASEVRAHGVSSGEKSVDGLLAKLKAASKKLGVFAQAFGPEAIVSERQLLLAHILAEKAFAAKENVANTMETEVLLRAAAQPRINEAIKFVGVKKPSQLILLTDASGEKLAKLLSAIGGKKAAVKLGGEKAAKLYGVTLQKGYTIEELLFEKMAMLAVER